MHDCGYGPAPWARLHHAINGVNLAHLIRVDLHSELLKFAIDEQPQRYLERLDSRLVLLIHTGAQAAEVGQLCKIIVDVVRLSELVTRQLEPMISQGLLNPGEGLPAERELAKRLGVSRPSLREAVSSLRSRGLIE